VELLARIQLAVDRLIAAINAVDAKTGGGGAALEPHDHWDEYHFANLTATPPFLGVAISSGTNGSAIPGAALDGKHIDGAFLRSSATANSGYRYQSTSLVTMYFGQRTFKWRGTWQHRTAHAGITLRAGFHDSVTVADAVDGAYFEIVAGVASAKTANNSVRTTHATTFPLVIGTIYSFDVEANVTGTEIRYRITRDVDQVTVFDQTIATNIPVTNARTFGAGLTCTCSAALATDMIILYSMGYGTLAGFTRARA